MPTMSHTDAQRKDWHSGKRRPGETRGRWIQRVLVRAGNFRGAYTPRIVLQYAPLKVKTKNSGGDRR